MGCGLINCAACWSSAEVEEDAKGNSVKEIEWNEEKQQQYKECAWDECSAMKEKKS